MTSIDPELRKALTGVSGILVTPFDAQDNVSPSRLNPIVDRAIGAGFHILVVNGNTGEFYGLTTAEAETMVHEVAELKAWGWRIPFVIGALAAIVAMFLRRSLAETATQEAMHNKEAGSVIGLLRNHPRAVLIVFAFTMGGSLYFYTFTTYMQKYLVNTAKMGAAVVTFVMTLVLVVFMLLQPVFGALSDHIGRKNNMILFTTLGALTSAPLLFALGSVESPYFAFALVLLALAIASFYTSISGVVKAELFPTEIRALGVGLTYAVANAAFGGTAEYVALWLKSTGHEPLFAWYVAGLVAIGLLASLVMPDTRKYGYLDGTGQVER
jgi:MFS family permease